MARKTTKRDSRYLATLVTGNRAPCAFCHREVDDEVTYGKLYAIGNIQCHYFCVLLSCCLVQKGHDEDGLFGFMYKDILAELERSKKHKCSYCSRGGASLGCSVGACRKQFHLPCGRERNAVSLYYGTYKSFCQIHAPKQKIPDHIMCKTKLRMKSDRKVRSKENGNKSSIQGSGNSQEDEMVCVICYEAVDAFPTVNTFWPPCCARDAWFHRSCLQRMALSAGMHYLKCPLCNDKGNFYDAVVGQGYYVPDRDAAWELEQNAFAEIYERPLTCTADNCECPMGRGHDADQGMWDIKLCLLCGSVGAHSHCIGASETTRYVCLTCTPAAPKDIQALANTIEDLIIQEQASSNTTVRRGPVMPSRMSLRRTKGRLAIDAPSSSKSHEVKTQCESTASPNIQSSRNELNLKTPRKQEHTNIKQAYADNKFLSPIKLLEQSFKERVSCMGVQNVILNEFVVDSLRRKIDKPRPLCVKKKIVEDVLERLFQDLSDKHKTKEPVKEWCTPKKCQDIEESEVTEATSENISKSHNKNKNNLKTPKKSTRRSSSLSGNVVTPKTSKIHNKTDSHITNAGKIIKSDKIINKIHKNEESKNENDDDDKKTNERINKNITVRILNVEHHQMSDVDDNKVNIGLKANQNVAENDKIIVNKNDHSSKTTQPSPEYEDNDSFKAFSTPKRKTVDIKQDSSLEISELDQSINIDVIKIEASPSEDVKVLDTEKCAFKFSPFDKEKLEKVNVDIDLECFKKGYLSEVDRKFNVNHNQVTDVNFRSVIDSAVDAAFKKELTEKRCLKRKMSDGSLVLTFRTDKKRKVSENDIDFSNSNAERIDKGIDVKTDANVEEVGNKRDKMRKRKRDRQGNKEKKIRKNRELKRIKKNKRINTDNLKDKRHYTTRKNIQDKEKEQMKENEIEKDLMDKDAETDNITEKNKEKQVKRLKRKQRRDKKSGKRKSDKEKRGNHDIRNGNDFDITIDSTKSKKNKISKNKTKLSIRNSEKDISVKIKWKKKQVRLKIESKKEKVVPKESKLKQYVLQYFAEVSPNQVLVKPEKEICPLKRKYVKQEKSPDKFKQMSIQNFFKAKLTEDK